MPFLDPDGPTAPWPHEGASGWWGRARALFASGRPADVALECGAATDRLAYAFAGGYIAALHALVPTLDRSRLPVLCVTERGGTHPRAIATEIRDGALFGDKAFVTLLAEADDLLVLAKDAPAEQGAIVDEAMVPLALVRVDARAPEVEPHPLPDLPFVPEVDHGSVSFRGAPIAERFDGDGWADYVRPFRTVEDAHVHLAVLAWLIESGRRWGWIEERLEEGLALLFALRAIASSEPGRPDAQLALAGVLRETERWLDRLDWNRVPEPDRRLWERDRALLQVAQKAREKRRRRAWQAL